MGPRGGARLGHGGPVRPCGAQTLNGNVYPGDINKPVKWRAPGYFCTSWRGSERTAETPHVTSFLPGPPRPAACGPNQQKGRGPLPPMGTPHSVKELVQSLGKIRLVSSLVLACKGDGDRVRGGQ